MLCLVRRQSEVVFITVPPSSEAQVIGVSIASLTASKVKLGFIADKSVEIARDNASGNRY